MTLSNKSIDVNFCSRPFNELLKKLSIVALGPILMELPVCQKHGPGAKLLEFVPLLRRKRNLDGNRILRSAMDLEITCTFITYSWINTSNFD